ncbi:MAG TPA: methyltransferase [Syntrophales bacterium]|nr:methyltransferase [Syntrophales bacterium]
MEETISPSSIQEQDLHLFLDALGVQLPSNPEQSEGYVVIALDSRVASLFESRDGKATLLGYRSDGRIYPLSIFFLRDDNEKVIFCHSVLILDSYAGNREIVTLLRQATQKFFSQNSEELLGTLEPSWRDADLKGHSDHRILWNMKPTLTVATDLFSVKFGTIPDIPLFPTVYNYNNPYLENLLEVSLPEIQAGDRALVLGTGAGLDAICIALKYEITVDATDINPIAVANTIAAARRVGVEHLVHSWVSDGFDKVPGKYDVILFEAPLAMEESDVKDINRYDLEGKLLKKILSALPLHLSTGGRMYLMSNPDLSLYFPATGLRARVRKYFEAKSSVAIHEIWLEDYDKINERPLLGSTIR